MSSYEFSAVRDGRHMTVVVESSTAERAERTLRKTTGASSVQLLRVSGVEAPAEQQLAAH